MNPFNQVPLFVSHFLTLNNFIEFFQHLRKPAQFLYHGNWFFLVR